MTNLQDLVVNRVHLLRDGALVMRQCRGIEDKDEDDGNIDSNF